jgi:hypothetical protein
VKKLLPFLARLVVVSLLLVPFLPLLHRAYAAVLALGAPAGTTALRYDGSGNLYTYLVLILAIPGLELRKRAIAAAVGIGAFLGADLFMTAVWTPYLRTPRPSLANMAVSYGWLVVAHYLLPFLLWLAFAFRQIERLLPERKCGNAG